MRNRKAVQAAALSLVLILGSTSVIPERIVFANGIEATAVSFDRSVPKGKDAGLILGKETGKNKRELAIELNDEYTKSVASLEVKIQFEKSKIHGVKLAWDKSLSSNARRASYNANTGVLSIYVVGKKDLREGNRVNLGTIEVESKETKAFESVVSMQAAKIVTLAHKSETLRVVTDGQTIGYTPTIVPVPTKEPVVVPTATPTAKPTNKPTATPTVKPTNKPTAKPTVAPTKKPSVVKVSAITLNKKEVTVKPGKTFGLKAVVTPSNATNKAVSYSSSNTKVATVSANGTITGKAIGTATITVKAKDGSGKKATCKVKVAGIQLSKKELSLQKGQTHTLKATVVGSNKPVRWTTSDKKVATVSNGKVTAKGVGTAVITASTTDGLKATVKIVVKQNKVEKIQLSAKSITLLPKQTKQLKATVLPSTAQNKAVSYSSSNKRVATVSATGKITAKAPGITTITVKAKDGSGKVATCKVKVNKVVVKNRQLTLKKGQSMQLRPAINKNSKVMYASNNRTIVRVTHGGKITARKKGTATITIETSSTIERVKVTVR